MKQFTYRLDTIAEAAQFILDHTEADVLLFYGAMGVGKTTFIKALCELLEVTDTVSSPSFGIVNEYHSPGGPIYHFDFYRIDDPEEALDFGVEEYLYGDCRVFAEWPDKIAVLLPDDAQKISIELMEDGTRKLQILEAP